MSAEAARPVALELDPQPVTPGDGGRFAAIFEAHAAHLFDYCHSLLADQHDAADATQATLVIAYSLIDRLQDAGRLRAWLFALARRECLSKSPVRAALPKRGRDSAPDRADPGPAPGLTDPDAGEPDTEEIRIAQIEAAGRAPERAAAAALAALPAGEREVLDLVYRHYLSPAELPAVLAMPADDAQALLAAAATGFESADQGSVDALVKTELHRATAEETESEQPESEETESEETQAGGVRTISLIPLVTLPPSVRRRTASVVLDPELASYRQSLGASAGEFGADGFPLPDQPGLHAAQETGAGLGGARRTAARSGCGRRRSVQHLRHATRCLACHP